MSMPGMHQRMHWSRFPSQATARSKCSSGCWSKACRWPSTAWALHPTTCRRADCPAWCAPRSRMPPPAPISRHSARLCKTCRRCQRTAQSHRLLGQVGSPSIHPPQRHTPMPAPQRLPYAAQWHRSLAARTAPQLHKICGLLSLSVSNGTLFYEVGAQIVACARSHRWPVVQIEDRPLSTMPRYALRERSSAARRSAHLLLKPWTRITTLSRPRFYWG